MNRFLGVVGLAAVMTGSSAACSGDAPGRRLHVGLEPPVSGDAGGSAGRGGAGGSGVDSHDNALRVRVEDSEGVTIEVVTLRCDGDCADIEAVAAGGNPPYSFTWDDGSTSAARRVCPGASGALSVTATDTAIDSEEFVYMAQTAVEVVTARTLQCADGGVPEGALCIENPSIEGTPGPPLLTVFDATPWQACAATGAAHVMVGNETVQTATLPLLPPQDGTTYGVISQDSGFGGRGTLAQALCAPIEAGQQVSFRVDVARSAPSTATDAEQAVLEVRGGAAPCSETQSLWRSAPLGFEWRTECITLRPTEAMTSLAFTLYGDGGELFNGLASVMIDHLVPVDACP